jgi:GT2 family glycosyltransferase
MSNSDVEVSVVVCHHVGNLLLDFLYSIKKSVGVTFEVIVITSDKKVALKGIPGCAVYYSSEGPASKRNFGARIAKGKYLAFFDDDTEIEPDCLLEFVRKMESLEDCGMVYGKLHNAEFRDRFDEAGGYLTSTGFIWSRAGQNDKDVGQYDEVTTILAGKSASCMIGAELFKKLDGFDEEFGILGEETDLSWRVWLSGARVYYVPTARGVHKFNTKWKPPQKYYTSSRVHFNGCRNYITMLVKNLEAPKLWTILPVHVLIWFFAGLAMIGTGKVGQGANIFRGLWYVIRNLRTVLRKRSIVQKRRCISDRTIWPHIFRRAPRGYYRTRILRYITLGLHG